MTWPQWFTNLGPLPFFWVMLAVMVAAFAAAITGVARKRYAIATLSVTIGIVVGLLIAFFGGMGAFCVAPPGAACA